MKKIFLNFWFEIFWNTIKSVDLNFDFRYSAYGTRYKVWKDFYFCTFIAHSFGCLIYYNCNNQSQLQISTTHFFIYCTYFQITIISYFYAHTMKFDVKSIYIYIYKPSRLKVSFSQCFDLVFDWLLHFLPILFCSRESRDQSPDREPSRRTRYNNNTKITNTFIISL